MATARRHHNVVRRRRCVLGLLCGTVASLLLVGVAAVPAYAKPTVPEIEKQISAATNKLEPIIEDYTGCIATWLPTRRRPTRSAKSCSRWSCRPTSRSPGCSHQEGPNATLALLLNSDSSAPLLDRMSLYDQIARQQHEQIAEVLGLRDQYAAAKKKLDATIAVLQTQNADLAAKKKTIEAQIASLQKLRQRVYGNNGGPIGKLRPVACPFTYIAGLPASPRGPRARRSANRTCGPRPVPTASTVPG